MTYNEAQKTTDGEILPAIASSSANCFVGVQYSSGYVGVLNEFSFFMDEFDDANVYG